MWALFIFVAMNKERYDIEAKSTRTVFEFISSGPKGNIRKAVNYSLIYIQDIPFYNLAFGDIEESTGLINDKTISDNGDRDKVLATVAMTVVRFTNNFPGAAVYATGSTPSRTRLYQMAISSNFEEINRMLRVFGYKDGKWVYFERDVNYEAFVVLPN